MPKAGSGDQNANPIDAFPEVFADSQKAFMEAQAEWLRLLRDASEHWTALTQAQAHVGAQWLSKLPELRTLPEAAEAIQQLVTQQAAVAAQDGKQVFEDCQKCMASTAKLMSAGWMPRAKSNT
jgi:hypothetical protein